MPRFVDLDTSFGANGKVITDFGGTDEAYSVAINPTTGKIIVAGFTNVNGSNDFALAGYLSNGNLDASFGTNGLVITDFGEIDIAYSVVIKPDGKIIVAGYTNKGSNEAFALAGYLPNGSFDASFGTNGKVITSFGSFGGACSIAIKPDGNIIVGGYTDPTSWNKRFALVGYLSDGNIDASFGTNGKVTTYFGEMSSKINSIAINPTTGKIIAAGYGGTDFALACYLPNGNIATSFGTNGKVITNLGGSDGANSVAIKPDGKIIAAGYTNGNFALVGYLSDGSFDASFGTNGKVITDFGGNDRAYSVAIKPDGKIIVAGYKDTDFALAGYLSDGNIDTSFGTNGKVITDFGGNDRAYSVAIKPDGKIIVAGYTDGNFALACYFGEKVAPISNVCFPANTLISTNQGNIAIQNLNPEIHTIRNKK